MNVLLVSRWSAALTLALALPACGGGSSGDSTILSSTPSTPPLTTPAPSQAAADRAAVLRLYEATQVHAKLAASPLFFIAYDSGKPWSSGPCASGNGSLQSTLDGGPVTSGVSLPTGSHSYSVHFFDCRVDGLLGTDLTGMAVADYTTPDWKTVTASVRFESMRATGLSSLSDLSNVTSDGSGRWSSTDNANSYTYTPARGSRLVNNFTTGFAVFQGGTYSVTQLTAPPGSSAAIRTAFDSIAITLNQVTYVLDGSVTGVFDAGGTRASYTGEVRITSEGALVGRVFGEDSTQLNTELLRPLAPF